MKRIRCLLLVVMSLGFAGQASAQNAQWGAVLQGDENVNHVCEKAVELGLGSVRFGIEWRYAQEFEYLPVSFPKDSEMNCFKTHNIHVLFSIMDAPAWANGGPGGEYGLYLPDLVKWKTFVKRVIEHYTYEVQMEDLITYGIWNEPENDKFLECGAIPNGQCYGWLFREAAKARDEVNPSARMAGPEMGTDGQPFDDALAIMQPWLRPQDVITVHRYCSGMNCGVITPFLNNISSKVGGREIWLGETGKNGDQVPQAEAISAILSAFAYRTLPNWTKLFIYKVGIYANSDDDSYSLTAQSGVNKIAFDIYRSWISVQDTAQLLPDQSLYGRQRITSPNGLFSLYNAANCGLTCYYQLLLVNNSNNQVMWSSANWTSTESDASKATFQAVDGNFVLSDLEIGGYSPAWATMAFSGQPKYLKVQDDGNLVAYDMNCNAFWQTGTGGGSTSDCSTGGSGGSGGGGENGGGGSGGQGGAPPESDTDSLVANETLYEAQLAVSENGRFVFVYQGDGNLVLYDYGNPIWASWTNYGVAGRAVMQDDGNFVIYDSDNVPLWSTGTWGHPGAWLVVQNDGNVVIKNSSGTILWQTGTGG